MPGNSFIKFKKKGSAFVPGESNQASHEGSKGWCEISDWSLDIEAETNFLKGTGAAVGVATPSAVSITHSFDKSSPTIMDNIVMGTSFEKVSIHMLKATGDASGRPEVYYAMDFYDAFITKISSKGGEDGSISQDVEFVFKKVDIGYKNQLNSGELNEKMKPFGWDIAKRTTVTGTEASFKPD